VEGAVGAVVVQQGRLRRGQCAMRLGVALASHFWCVVLCGELGLGRRELRSLGRGCAKFGCASRTQGGVVRACFLGTTLYREPSFLRVSFLFWVPFEAAVSVSTTLRCPDWWLVVV